ncbi:trimethylamine methyltransferase family protein [Pelagibius litoralis]|uniref:Methyltransferase n=2 Tax=Pelagibius litoralis TaxID=374515 RepID=A0A967KHX1_9PROT|nr:trimethylamine methyltransferase family protein [Pelagibius litoralis]
MLNHKSDLPAPEKPGTAPRRRGRVARREARVAAGREKVPQALRRIPAYTLLDEESLIAIEEQADWILSRIGVEFRGDDTALALFREAGATVEGARVRFDPGHARALCATAPATYRLHGRDPDRSVTLGGDHVVLMPGYGSPFVTDLDRGRRYASLEDFRNFVKLTYLSPWLNHSGGTVCEPVDVPVNTRHLDMVYAHLRYSTKPFMGGVTAPERARDSLDMARIVFGGFMDSHAVIQANINVNSPLVYDGTMSGALRVYAAAKQSVAISPAIFGGAMGPVSQPAVIAQTLAEGMVGIALAQLVRTGCPVVLGSFHSTMNLKSGALTFGSPEANLSTMALSQLGRRLGVPVRSGGGQITAANSADGQAMQESSMAMLTSILSGANQIWHAAGWLEGGLTMGYEKFVMDVDHCGMLLRLIEGLVVDDESLAREAYLDTGPGENFLSTRHTLRHFEQANYLSALPEAGPYETWLEQGSRTAEQRANGCWKAMLAAYEAPAIDPGVDEALRDFIDRKKSSLPERWHE